MVDGTADLLVDNKSAFVKNVIRLDGEEEITFLCRLNMLLIRNGNSRLKNIGLKNIFRNFFMKKKVIIFFFQFFYISHESGIETFL